MAKLKITWIKSAIGYPQDQKETVQALGLHRLNQVIEVDDSGSVRGMITKVRHLVRVEAVTGTASAVRRASRSKKPSEGMSHETA